MLAVDGVQDYFFPKPEEDPAAAAAAAAKKPTESLLKSMLTRTLKGGKNEPAKPSAGERTFSMTDVTDTS